ncbi:TauD/TfdA dioxygenase family protein [Nocardia brasiliensis]|uniref:TauD/TfdA dioxygenase family protein n=1 Tax=Nocardia brasiliensis TaxID=37326 RepID=UPI0024558F37|nr:TauD/TfdA family dioxygenase [Nocardia brasiliensis]
MSQKVFQRISVAPVAGHIGADIEGVDLSASLDGESIAEIRDALLSHKVVFFRDQKIGHAEQIAFGRRFGELTLRPRPQSGGALDEFPEICTISPTVDLERYGRDIEAHFRSRWTSAIGGWHTDMTHAVNPPMASILRAETAPTFGGDTQWTNLVAAYEGLSAPLRRLVDELHAEHSFWAGYQMAEHDEVDRPILEMVNARGMVAVHPVVRVHPETDERALFVSPSRTSHILGMSRVESRRLLDLLFEQITRAEYTVRFRWAPGSVAFWDNRSTAHIGAADVNAADGSRILHRVTLVGNIPVGPDGFTSTAVTGRPFGGTSR